MMTMNVEKNINCNKLGAIFNRLTNNRVIKFSQDKKFLITGCQGSRVSFTKIISGKQEIVANAMHTKLSKKQDLNAYLGMLLGDHFYPSGTTDQNSAYFKNGFEDVYHFNIPFFNVLGNHDWNFHGSQFNQSADDADHNKRAAAQVLRTFNANNAVMPHLQSEVQNGYQLKHWNMPGRYYCLEFPSSVLFVIDSNTYVFDRDQQHWLSRVYLQYQHKKKVLVSHHPFFSYGKRSTPKGKQGDIEKYWLNEYSNGENVMHLDKSMNELLHKKITDEQGLKFDILLSAHDHMLAVSEHGGMTQIIMGGGGSPLERIKVMPASGTAKSAYGFMEFSTADLSYQITEVVPQIMPGKFRTQTFFSSQMVRRRVTANTAMTENPAYEGVVRDGYDHLALHPQLRRSKISPSTGAYNDPRELIEMTRLESRPAFVEPDYESIASMGGGDVTAPRFVRPASQISQGIYEEMPEQPSDAPTIAYEDAEAVEVEEDATAADIIATAVGNFEGQYSQPNVVDPCYPLYSTVNKGSPKSKFRPTEEVTETDL